MERNLTTGSVSKNIAVFSLPYFLAFFLQALYGLADMYFIGRYNGADVITAVSVGSQVMHMFTVMTVGFATATTVLVGRAVGSRDRKAVEDTIGNSVTLFMGLSVVLTVLLLFLARPIVLLMQTPDVAVEEAVHYLLICFAGIPFIVAYNVIAAIFRGLGDSKTPMYFVAVACVINIGLDYVLIGPLHMKAAGAAYGTIIAQAVAVLIALAVIWKKKSLGALSKGDLKPDKTVLSPLAKIGVPVMLQEGFIQVSFIIITIIANLRGEEIAAAVGIVEKIITFVFLVPSTMMATTSALSAQNIGAGKPARAEKTMWYCMAFSFSFGMVFFALCQFLAPVFVGGFTTDANVIMYGAQYLRSYSIDAAFAAVHFCFSGYFTACGVSYISFLHNAVSIVTARVPGTWFAYKLWPETLYPMGWAAPIGSFISIVICLAVFLYRKKHDKNPAVQ